MKLNQPDEGYTMQTQGGKPRTFGVERHKTCVRIRLYQWRAILDAAQKYNVNYQDIIDEALAYGLAAAIKRLDRIQKAKKEA